MPYINVNDAYILDNTGKQVDDAVDYALANSNRNLLDNPWWGSGEVVNQRSVTAKPSSNGAYCIDRWTWNSGADANNMSLGANGITFTRSASNIWFAQKMANPSALVGKMITGSVMLSDGTIKSGSVVYASVGSTPTLYQDSAVQIYISSVGAFSLTIKTTQTIRAVKLELGSYSTLANDVPPDFADELRKCRFYYRRYANPLAGGMSTITGGTAISATAADFTDNEPMYGGNAGTLAYNGTVQVNGVAVTGKTLYSRSDGKISQNTMRFNVSGGLTAYGSALITLGANSYIELSHDL